MNKTEQRLAELRAEEAKLLEELKRQRTRKLFDCACGKRHPIKDLFLVEVYYGSGGEWDFSEYRIDCPDQDNLTNRLLWDTNRRVEWRLRNHYDHSAESQFSRLYSDLFKKIPVERFGVRSMGNPRLHKSANFRGDHPEKDWVNNYSIDHNHEYWGIKLKDFDYAKFKKELADRRRKAALAAKAKKETVTE